MATCGVDDSSDESQGRLCGNLQLPDRFNALGHRPETFVAHASEAFFPNHRLADIANMENDKG